MRKANGQDNIFDLLMTDKDRIIFNEFFSIRASKNPIIFTNDKNVIITQEDLKSMIWIFTKGDLSCKDQTEITSFLKNKLEYNNNLEINGVESTMEPILEMLSRDFNIKYKIRFPKIAHYCKGLIVPSFVKGKIKRAELSDIATISKFIKHNFEDLGFGLVPDEDAMKSAEIQIKRSNLYLWEDDAKNIVAMAKVHRTKNIGCIDGVFTDRNNRNKGYAQAIIYQLTADLIKNNALPVLYTDARNIASNRAYQKVGYVPCGEIIQFAVEKEI